MIPPWMLTPLAKIVATGLALAILWGWGYLAGRADMKQAWEASLAQQAAKSAAEIIKDAQVTNEVLKDHAEASRQTEAAVQVLEREVIRYVQAPTKPCSVDPEFVRLFDELSRLPALRADRLPAEDGPTGNAAEPSPTDLTTTEVLQAYERAAEELASLWTDYYALVQWERKQAAPTP